jgi:hypothetical protein
MTRPPAEQGRELAALVGGPLDRWWYWRDDLERQQDTARWSAGIVARLAPADRPPRWRPPSVLAYQPTQDWTDNPLPAYGAGRIWTYTRTQETPR